MSREASDLFRPWPPAVLEGKRRRLCAAYWRLDHAMVHP
jgi:hypothetical protein